MKKQELIKLAFMGISSGVLISAQAQAETAETAETPATEANGCGGKSGCGGENNEYSNNQGNYGFHILSEDELVLELNEKGEALYMSLSDEGKDLARKVASQRCNGTNLCKGLNACQTENHSCAGQGSCKGQGKCGFSDKNLAVKVVSIKMAKEKQ